MLYIYFCVESLYPDIKADKEMEKNAKKAMLMEAAAESVNKLSITSRKSFVSSIAAEDAEISRYAVT